MVTIRWKIYYDPNGELEVIVRIKIYILKRNIEKNIMHNLLHQLSSVTM